MVGACCILVMFVSLMPATAEQLREPRIVRRAWSIWSPIKPGTVVHEKYQQLRADVARGDWKHAIDAANSLTAMIPQNPPRYERELPWEWRVAIADLYVYDGQLSKAIGLVDAILNEVPKDFNPP